MSTEEYSKRLISILRHVPEDAGLTLGDGGWVFIDELLSGLSSTGQGMDRAELARVVETNDKKRFTISDDGHRIRAAQGHSVKFNSDLEARDPPAKLYHGTAKRFLNAIRREGLRPMSRQHVHLSRNVATAEDVGKRHGEPFVLTVASSKMATAGNDFFCADNGVWLTDRVPAEFLTFNLARAPV